MEKRTYTMTSDEARRYDSGDDEHLDELDREFEHRFGWHHPPIGAKVKTEIFHPKGHVSEIRFD
jgi:hypothetical protein